MSEKPAAKRSKKKQATAQKKPAPVRETLLNKRAKSDFAKRHRVGTAQTEPQA